MWVSDDSERYFTCQDLHDAGVTTSRRGDVTHEATCCSVCHGWSAWHEHPTGLVIHQFPNGAWLICCCCWTFDRPDAWVLKHENDLLSGPAPVWRANSASSTSKSGMHETDQIAPGKAVLDRSEGALLIERPCLA